MNGLFHILRRLSLKGFCFLRTSKRLRCGALIHTVLIPWKTRIAVSISRNRTLIRTPAVRLPVLVPILRLSTSVRFPISLLISGLLNNLPSLRSTLLQVAAVAQGLVLSAAVEALPALLLDRL